MYSARVRFSAVRLLPLVLVPLASLAFNHASAAPRADDAAEARRPTAARPTLRWTDETPDAMIDRAVERASTSDRSALSAIATIDALAERAGWGHAPQALDAIAHLSGLGEMARAQASLAARTMASDEGTDGGIALDRRLGVVTDSLDPRSVSRHGRGPRREGRPGGTRVVVCRQAGSLFVGDG